MKAALDESDLLRMDSSTLGEYLGNLIQKGILAPNEARAKLGYGPVPGGASPYLQVQNYSLAALAARDNAGPAPGTAGDAPPPPPGKMIAPPIGRTLDIAAEVRKHLPAPVDLSGMRRDVETMIDDAERVTAAAHTALQADLRREIDELREEVRSVTESTIEERDADGKVVSTMTTRTRFPKRK